MEGFLVHCTPNLRRFCFYFYYIVDVGLKQHTCEQTNLAFVYTCAFRSQYETHPSFFFKHCNLPPSVHFCCLPWVQNRGDFCSGDFQERGHRHRFRMYQDGFLWQCGRAAPKSGRFVTFGPVGSLGSMASEWGITGGNISHLLTLY